MNTLLHICCAPCANQCIEVLRTDGYELTGFWYNPNIHPFTEYRSRQVSSLDVFHLYSLQTCLQTQRWYRVQL